MSQDELEILDSFKNSPINQRFLDICIDLDDSDFEERIPRWLSKVSKSGCYKKQDIRQFWLFRIEDANGVPKPKARLTQIPRILERKGEKNIRAIEVVPSIEGQPPRLRFWQWRPGKRVTRFAELKAEVDRWLPDFQKEFGIEKFGGIWLHYLNDIGKIKHPKLWPEGSLKLSETLIFFQGGTRKLGTYVHPYRQEAIQKVDESEGTVFKTTFESTDSGIFNVIFECGNTHHPFERTLEEVDKEIETAHEIILSQFAEHFTEETLQYFKG